MLSSFRLVNLLSRRVPGRGDFCVAPDPRDVDVNRLDGRDRTHAFALQANLRAEPLRRPPCHSGPLAFPPFLGCPGSPTPSASRPAAVARLARAVDPN